ncbi:hypothetical protein AVEN_225443-1 [Araneus ventricosus]|uniref:Uncharacterized protein n=1 Tax=Araneus ventricosus TaxID=182803 RepID=A0A4Y2PRF8_ARAVE|nr:hypothetical protein AVEN_225443-1 [Araneus ventricosus]
MNFSGFNDRAEEQILHPKSEEGRFFHSIAITQVVFQQLQLPQPYAIVIIGEPQLGRFISTRLLGETVPTPECLSLSPLTWRDFFGNIFMKNGTLFS